MCAREMDEAGGRKPESPSMKHISVHSSLSRSGLGAQWYLGKVSRLGEVYGLGRNSISLASPRSHTASLFVSRYTGVSAEQKLRAPRRAASPPTSPTRICTLLAVILGSP